MIFGFRSPSSFFANFRELGRQIGRQNRFGARDMLSPSKLAVGLIFLISLNEVVARVYATYLVRPHSCRERAQREPVHLSSAVLCHSPVFAYLAPRLIVQRRLASLCRLRPPDLHSQQVAVA